MDPNKDNANPTILSASDLPSRRREAVAKKRTDGGTGLFDNLVPAYSYWNDPFEQPLSSPSDSEEDDDTVEVIDEQEIYGAPPRNHASYPSCTTIQLPSKTIPLELYIPQKTYIANTSVLYHTDLISTISDPEHPLSLGSLAVVNLPDILITHPSSPRSPISTVLVEITPTITHCSLATVIGLGVRVRLEQALPPRFRVDVRIKEGTHSTGEAVNKQLGDKERVAAALENGTLMGVIRRMLATCE
ncbi:hypothetical protein LTS18_003259 [Coniosporium uncinatum]|uniref:Uncharacterized protein n=1 Tax=Coniosporium uncinatum TaxID=93489 RepID=A0ACC3DTZ8_9PEZI|nr:hypothetical protein LTS18_003259 [Coniosporium uncinatum]